jgi:small subunit ribosomal protein S1
MFAICLEHVRGDTMMDKNFHEYDTLDESYWQALLNEGEIARTVSPESLEEWRAIAAGPQGIPAHNRPRLASSPDQSWQVALNAQESNEVCTAQVVGYNRGGLLVDWQDLRGFVPASHLVGLSPVMDEESRKAEFARRVGWNLCVKVIEVDRAQGRLILSERATSSEESRREALWEDLCEGAVRRGYVTNVCAFGAFVDLGGLEGLVHISEISWGRVNHPGDVLGPGDPVEVFVISVDRMAKRVALSLKRLRPDPWTTVRERYQLGQLVTGTITNVVSFGAFMRLEDGVEGLIHVSELAEGQFLHPRNVVKEGDEVTARVLNIDRHQRRLGLSLRKVDEAQVPEAPADTAGQMLA